MRASNRVPRRQVGDMSIDMIQERGLIQPLLETLIRSLVAVPETEGAESRRYKGVTERQQPTPGF